MTNLNVGDTFPDFMLPDHRGSPKTLSGYTKPSQVDEKLGFQNGYPIVLIFSRGFFCPRDQEQMRQLVGFQNELKVNYCKLAVVNADPPMVSAAFRAGLGASFPFLSDEHRAVIKQIGVLDETEGEYAYRSRPFAFVLRPDLTVYRIYDGWFFVGRPTLEELRHDLRAIMQKSSNYSYEAFDTPEVKSIRIPQQEWLEGAPPLGANGLPVADGVVKSFDLASGNGEISRDADDEDVFFNFTAIPGEGYRTVRPGTRVRFEIVEHPNTGPTARNVRLKR
ncbi:MAG: redoxin domain-containing protein [Rubrobacteraceae bacterium]|nr:redoxin domain-containing protein [Rubrobacteraceae bacterium]